MNRICGSLIPILLAFVPLYAMGKHVEVFPTFINGARTGLHTAISILPTMIGMLTAVYMLRASGCIDLFGKLFAPALTILGIPTECAPLVFLKPVSGGGGLALGSEIMKRAGVDSYAGRVAAVMLGASETSIYTISIYSGHVGLRNTRYAVPAALLADFTAFVSAAFFVRIFL